MTDTHTFRGFQLPHLTLRQTRQLCAILAYVPPHRLEDAVQEAWVVQCQGQDVVLGLTQWQERELGQNPGITDQPRGRTRVVRPVTERLETVDQRQVRQQF